MTFLVDMSAKNDFLCTDINRQDKTKALLD